MKILHITSKGVIPPLKTFCFFLFKSITPDCFAFAMPSFCLRCRSAYGKSIVSVFVEVGNNLAYSQPYHGKVAYLYR